MKKLIVFDLDGTLAESKASLDAEMLFIGDALFPGGNDYPAKKAGAVSIQVRDPEESKRVIEAIVACLNRGQGAKLQVGKSR